MLHFPAVFFCLLAVSCTKQPADLAAPAQASNSIIATVSSGQSYVFNTGSSRTMSISRQALHYQVSEATVDEKNGNAIYKYVPAAGYKGADEVTLLQVVNASENNNDGCQGHHSYTSGSNVIVIKINVTD